MALPVLSKFAINELCPCLVIYITYLCFHWCFACTYELHMQGLLQARRGHQIYHVGLGHGTWDLWKSSQCS